MTTVQIGALWWWWFGLKGAPTASSYGAHDYGNVMRDKKVYMYAIDIGDEGVQKPTTTNTNEASIEEDKRKQSSKHWPY